MVAIRFVRGSDKGSAIDDRSWQRLRFSRALRCDQCGIDYPEPEPQLFNFNRPLGTCPECEGFGNIVTTDMSRVVPDPTKSIRAGAIAPGFTRTEILDAMKPEMIERALNAVPLKRMAEPAEMAHAAVFIAENDYFSGRVIEVDGAQRI